MNTYRLTLLAILASLAVIGRIAFSQIPNVQPVTSIIIICGFFLGPLSAVLLAVLTTYLSNLLLGMGFWTIWQIIAWTFIGLISGVLGLVQNKYSFYLLVMFSVISGYLYGFVVSLATFIVSGKFIPYYLAGLPYDTYHAIGNCLFMIILFPVLSIIFERYKKKWLNTKLPTPK
ncbi:ECF transporter S component [Aquibacillus albus]|uniref:Energy-coupling factor transport system substrate-specific component n=1 Tax=Aquibacillus albus TaxID=1168171 RepID=A0ABS2MV92_9BACI|nr:ECF transporter S component [Aquibacillus albus]MBM7569789.1 energy-coupling factor transport system substrate-specific component [Aquibacillus albus]